MKATSATMPDKLYDITDYGDTSEIRVKENITEIEATETEPARWEYDEYTMTVRSREGLAEGIEGNIEAWVTAAKSTEYNTLAAKIREERDKLLQNCDWTQTIDAPLSELEKTAWREYRQELRDIPQQAEFPYAVIFPNKP